MILCYTPLPPRERYPISLHPAPQLMINHYKAIGGADCVPRAIAYPGYGDEVWSPDSYREGGREMYEIFCQGGDAAIGRCPLDLRE